MLELKNLSFRVEAESGKTEILKSINLTVPDKSFLVITGPNGGGKTTLAKVIMGIVTPTEGKILWNGKDITNLRVDAAGQHAVFLTAFSSRPGLRA